MHYSDLQASPPAASELEQLGLTDAPTEEINAMGAPGADDALELHAHDLAIWRTRTPARLKIADIEVNTNAHARTGLDTSIIDEMRASIRAHLPIAPVVVFKVDGTNRYCLADGFHRLEAVSTSGIHEIEAEVIEGDRDSATRFAIYTNAQHGRRLNLGDLRLGYSRYVEQRRFAPLDAEVVAQVLGCSIRYAYELTEEERERHDRERDVEIARRRTVGETYRSIARALDLPLATVKGRHVRFMQSAKTEHEAGPPHDVVLEAPETEVEPPVKSETGQPETSSTLTTAATSPSAEFEPLKSPPDEVTEAWGNILAAARSVHHHLPSGEWLGNNPCPRHLRAKLARELRAAETRFHEVRAAFDASADPHQRVPST